MNVWYFWRFFPSVMSFKILLLIEFVIANIIFMLPIYILGLTCILFWFISSSLDIETVGMLWNRPRNIIQFKNCKCDQDA